MGGNWPSKEPVGKRRKAMHSHKKGSGTKSKRTRILGRSSAGMKRRALAQLANSTTAGFLGLEKKFYDTGLILSTLSAPTGATSSVYNPSATSLISTPAQGDGELDRDGKRIVIKSVHINGVVLSANQKTQSVPPPGTTVYVALVLDTQTNGAALTSELVFKNTIGQSGLATVPMRNLLYANRFKILKSEQFNMDSESLSHFAVDSYSNNGQVLTFSWYLPMELPINFNAGTTASVANVVDNSLHIIAFANNVIWQTQLAYNARIRFMG